MASRKTRERKPPLSCGYFISQAMEVKGLMKGNWDDRYL